MSQAHASVHVGDTRDQARARDVLDHAQAAVTARQVSRGLLRAL